MNRAKKFKNFFLFFMIVLIFSCSSDNSAPNISQNDDYILADYIIDVGFIKDFSINNREVNYLYTGNSSGELSVSLRKINKSGDLSILDELDFLLFGNNMGITYSEDGNIYYVTDSGEGGNKVYNYSVSSSSTSSYSMTPISSPSVGPIRMNTIENLGDGSYVIFDYSALGLRRYFPDLETDVIIAGSGNSFIVDGQGLNSSFKFVTKLLSVDEVIYLIDDSNNLRKIERDGSNFNVVTLISNYTNIFNDISVDNNGNILVLINNLGIYKLNTLTNTLEEYLTGEIKIKYNTLSGGTGFSTSEWGFFDKFIVDSNDLYLYSFGEIIKISGFESKI